MPELLPLFRPRQGFIEAGLREPHGEGGDSDPTCVERGEELVEALSTLAEQIIFGNTTVFEVEWVLVRGAPAEFLVGRTASVTRRVLRDDDRGEFWSSVFTGACPGDDRNAACDVGACLLFRQAESPKVLTSSAPGEKLLLLLLRAVGC